MLKDLVSLNMVKLMFFALQVLRKEYQFFLKTQVKDGLQLNMVCYPDPLIQEIQRLIGRSLRSIIDLKSLGERQVIIDCDVIQADGGTRTASITGGWIALSLAVRRLMHIQKLKSNPIISQICAISCGIWNGFSILDLDYSEDSSAEVDTNFVITSDQKLVEIQISSESEPFEREKMNELTDLAITGTSKIFDLQLKALHDS